MIDTCRNECIERAAGLTRCVNIESRSVGALSALLLDNARLTGTGVYAIDAAN